MRIGGGGGAKGIGLFAVSVAKRSTSHVTRHTSHVTRHTSHRAKRIRTHAVVNEDINKKIIRELRCDMCCLCVARVYDVQQCVWVYVRVRARSCVCVSVFVYHGL